MSDQRSHSGPAAWLLLARFADAVERSGSTVQVTRDPGPPGNRQDIAVQIRFALPLAAIDSLATDGTPEAVAMMCERLGVKWSEAAQWFGTIDAVAELPSACDVGCTCRAPAGQWCRPTHEGERVSGGWVHPLRVKFALARECNAHALVHDTELGAPSTTDYCVQCGESPESATHFIAGDAGHAYVDPRVDGWIADVEDPPEIPTAENVPLPNIEEFGNTRPPDCICHLLGRICPVHPKWAR